MPKNVWNFFKVLQTIQNVDKGLFRSITKCFNNVFHWNGNTQILSAGSPI